MFKLARNDEIGIYIKNLIVKKYKSQAEFCREWIKAENGVKTEQKNRENKLSTIINGTVCIQIEYLPIFSLLLNVTCEEILSAGKYFIPGTSRLTNYSVALSRDKNVWDQYIGSDDKLIFYRDEYGKTLLDYVLEYKNIELLKYLLDNNVIWFVDTNKSNHSRDFGAGTSIECKNIRCDIRMGFSDNYKLRPKAIILAVENNDVDMLIQLHARETPVMYHKCYIGMVDSLDYYESDMHVAIANASEQVLDYFTEEFEITNQHSQTNKFMYPYMFALLNELVRNNSKYAKKALIRSIEHNKSICENIIQFIKDVVPSYNILPNRHYYPDDYIESSNRIAARSLVNFYLNLEPELYESGDFISFRDPNSKTHTFFTNIIHVNEKSQDEDVNHLIEELNDSYNQIINIKENIEKLI